MAEVGHLREVVGGVFDGQLDPVVLLDEADGVVWQVNDPVTDRTQLSSDASGAPKCGFIEGMKIAISTESFGVVYQQLDQSSYKVVHA